MSERPIGPGANFGGYGASRRKPEGKPTESPHQDLIEEFTSWLVDQLEDATSDLGAVSRNACKHRAESLARKIVERERQPGEGDRDAARMFFRRRNIQPMEGLVSGLAEALARVRREERNASADYVEGEAMRLRGLSADTVLLRVSGELRDPSKRQSHARSGKGE